MAYDVIVVGIGGMGSATLWRLARGGKRVLGLEAFDIPNAMGSSHGLTRIIRLPYYESSEYVPLLLRAYQLWSDIESATNTKLLHITGSIDASKESAPLFQGALRAATLHGLDHEVLTGKDVNARFPGYQLPQEFLALFQPEGGFIASERAIVAHVKAAQNLGAEVHAREQVTGWKAHPGGEGMTVTTDHGHYEGAALVLTAGAWIGQLAPLLKTLAIPERQVLAWLQPQFQELFGPDRFPVFNIQVEEGRYYGLPIFEVPGFKFGRYHHLRETGSVKSIRRDADQNDEALLRGFAQRYFPKGCGPTMALRSCFFTNTPDEHFIIDLHPEHPQIVLASPCSGHGYKFCSVMGEILADLAIHRRYTRHNIAFLGLNRFALSN